MSTNTMSNLLKNGMLIFCLMIATAVTFANEGITTTNDVADGSEVLGVWEGDNNMERFEIFKEGDLYYGKIVWTAYKDIDNIEGRGLLDLENPDSTKRSESIVGLTILLDFKYKGNGVYSAGRVYDPGSGNTYKCKIKVDGDNAKIRGFILVPLLGRTETAFRVK